MTRAEFVAQFRVPENTTEAYNLGKRAGCCGHGRLSFREFFQNDVPVRLGMTPRDSLYRAYKRGHSEGREQRARREPLEGAA